MTTKRKESARVGKARGKPATKNIGKTSPPPRYTKNQALLDVMKAGGGTRDVLVAAMDKLYAKHGGKSNPDGTRLHIELTLPTLLAFGVIAKDESGAYRLVKR
jgi:hypothetical protein